MEEIQNVAKEMGSKGGKKTAEIYGTEHYRKNQLQGAKTRKQINALRKMGCKCDKSQLLESRRKTGHYKHDDSCLMA